MAEAAVQENLRVSACGRAWRWSGRWRRAGQQENSSARSVNCLPEAGSAEAHSRVGINPRHVPPNAWRARASPKSPEPLPRENAEQLFRRLIASKNPPANACYVLAAMLERKRLLKQVKTESLNDRKRVLIYEQPATGDVFVVPDPQLRLGELETVQNEVAQLLSAANQNQDVKIQSA